jgi:hypothetical protein
VGTDKDQNAPDYLQFADDLEMVTKWKYLGFVVNQGSDENGPFVEVEKVPFPKGDDPDCGGG